MSKGKYYFSKSVEKGLRILALFNQTTSLGKGLVGENQKEKRDENARFPDFKHNDLTPVNGK